MMAESKIQTVQLADGTKLSGYTAIQGKRVFERIRHSHSYYECYTLERWFLPAIRGGQCVYDIGANLGNRSIYFATHSKASVFSFEPVNANFKLLEKNIEQNGLACAQSSSPLLWGRRTGARR